MFEEWISITASMTLKFVAKDLSISYVFRNCNSMKIFKFRWSRYKRNPRKIVFNEYSTKYCSTYSVHSGVLLSSLLNDASLLPFRIHLSLFLFIYFVSFSFRPSHRLTLEEQAKKWRGQFTRIFIFLSINAKMKKIYYYILLKIIRLSLGPPPPPSFFDKKNLYIRA